MKRYYYYGPVYIFMELVNAHWEAETMAVSKKKALSNFKYQYKKQRGLTMDTRIDLKGDIVEQEED